LGSWKVNPNPGSSGNSFSDDKKDPFRKFYSFF